MPDEVTNFEWTDELSKVIIDFGLDPGMMTFDDLLRLYGARMPPLS